VAGFEDCSLPGSAFRHREHVRLTLIYVRRYGEMVALARLEDGLKRYATHNGAADKFHYTITRAWLRLVASAAGEQPTAAFDELVARRPELLDKSTLGRHYSSDVLGSDRARLGFVEPDLEPLPACRPQAEAH
jgi:hypothetical protein